MSDTDKEDYEREAAYIESGHGEVTTGTMRYAHKRIAELEAQLASAEQPSLEALREASIDMGKYVWVETSTWDSVMNKESER